MSQSTENSIQETIPTIMAQPVQFPSTGFEVIPDSEILEEEMYDDFRDGKYYPVQIGDVFASRYQIHGKLGFGTSSTAWLAYDLQEDGHVVLKIYTRDGSLHREFENYEKINAIDSEHIGYYHLRPMLDEFDIPREGGDHKCLVSLPLCDSLRDMLGRFSSHRFDSSILKAGLIELFSALDYLHTECKIIHTDIKADNILTSIEDDSILHDFTAAEIENPSPRKLVQGIPIYASRGFARPGNPSGRLVLCDFGSGVDGDQEQHADVQPNVYRSPEVMLSAPWSYPIDIWNVGAMIWDLFEGKHMFYGNDPDGSGYKTRAHLAEAVGLLGLPPVDLLKRGRRSHEFFTEEGQWKAEIDIPNGTSLEQSEENLEGEDKAMFLKFMRSMLQWRPEDRKTARELLSDPWLNSSSQPDEVQEDGEQSEHLEST